MLTQDNIPALINAQEVASILGIKQSAAYNIIREYNKKLKEAGKITIRGKLNRKYFFKQLDVSDVE